MNAVRFRKLVADAVASREPIDTEEFARLAAEAGDERFWHSQVDLERAIAAWGTRAKQHKVRRIAVRRISACAAALAAGFGAVWLARPMEPVGSSVPSAPTVKVSPAATIVLATPVVAVRPVQAPVVAPRPPQDQRMAEAAATAERLAYALQPVGEQVSSVVRLLIDAVPGADVFAL